MTKVSTLFFLLLYTYLAAQNSIYLGAGNHENIIVKTSSNFSRMFWEEEASGSKTIRGQGLDARRLEASRFLAQSTLGASSALIDQVAEVGIEAWLDSQFEEESWSMLEKIRSVNKEVNDWFLQNGGDSSEVSTSPSWLQFNYAWWDSNMRNTDLVRQRIAFTLTEIFVISVRSELEGYGEGLASYYDIFAQNAFGNYRDILKAVSLHPCMGFFLSHLNNPRSNPEENIHPDENYAREAMQLFSIGLYELNLDGTRKLDSFGQDIPTYGQDEIKEFAKIWTGLGVGAVIPGMVEDGPFFGLGIYGSDLTVPMKMYDEYHEPGEKRLLNGLVVPDQQSGMEDIEDAIDNLFHHDNVGPFMAHRLIQRLVKANPSPAYVKRVAEAFNDNGQGVRGDMKAVVKAILLDEEARDCEWINHHTQGLLREPYVRYSHFVQAIDVEQYYGRFWNAGYSFWEETGQAVFGAPSVFNFFLPDFQPVGPLADEGLVGPVFQIHNSRTSVGMMNQVNGWAVYGNVMGSWSEFDPNSYVNYDDLRDLGRDPEVLINHLDLLFTHGQLSNRTRSIIKEAIEDLIYEDYREDRVKLALYLLMVSPDYAILK